MTHMLNMPQLCVCVCVVFRDHGGGPGGEAREGGVLFTSLSPTIDTYSVSVSRGYINFACIMQHCACGDCMLPPPSSACIL